MRTAPLFALFLLTSLAIGCSSGDDSGTEAATGGSAGAGGDGSGGGPGAGGASGANTTAGGAAGASAVCDDGAGGEAPVEMIEHDGNWQIMLLGDSITQSTCYPQLLSKTLIEQGRDGFDFIGGTTTNQGCGTGAPAVSTEGHGGYLVTDLVSSGSHEGELEAWLAALLPEPVGAGGAGGTSSADGGAGGSVPAGGAANSGGAGGALSEGGAANVAGASGAGGGAGGDAGTTAGGLPEVALVHFGTNDAWNGRSTDRILDAYTFVVEQLRAANPDVIMVFAQIIPLAPTESSCSACPTRVEELNAAIPDWATDLSTDRSPIHVVDVHTCFDVETDTRDGVHPNPDGSQKMADDFAAALHRAGVL